MTIDPPKSACDRPKGKEMHEKLTYYYYYYYYYYHHHQLV